MTNLRQAAQQALEALEAIKWKGQPSFVEDAIAALRAALNLPESRNQCGETCERAKLCAICAQGINLPEQEPVAWLYTLEYGTEIADRQVFLDQRRYPFGVCGADYLQASADGTSYVRETPLYTAPIPRKPLTDEAIMDMVRDMCIQMRWPSTPLEIARAIERAHGIKE